MKNYLGNLQWSLQRAHKLIKIPLIFWYIKGHCSYRTHNFLNILKMVYIEASLPKRQVVEYTTLWCNSVAKHGLCRRRSMPASTSLPVKPRPLIRTCSRQMTKAANAGLHKNQQGTIQCRIFERLKLKDDAVLTILDLTSMLQHTSVSNCFYYVIA